MAIGKKQTWRIVGLVVMIVCAVVYGAYRLFRPYDEVATHIQGIPPNTAFVCLVARTDHGLQVMEWSLAKVFPFSMHPKSCTVSWLFADETSHHAKVRWVFSERVGVLCKTSPRKWIVSWFDPAKAQPINRSFLFGGGSVTVDLANADAQEPMDDAQLRSLGMDDSLTHTE